MIRQNVLPYAAYGLVRAWTGTWRYLVHEPPELSERLAAREPIVFAHWHGDELNLIPLIRPYRVATMTSTSKDGELMNRFLKILGAETSRGSSTRGAIGALKGLVRLMKSGHNSSMAVDGPKGPLHQVKPGVFELARLVKAPIYCAGVALKSKIRFEKAWNKAELAKPFGTVQVYWQGPYTMDKGRDPRDPELAKSLAEALHEAHRQASKIIAPHDA